MTRVLIAMGVLVAAGCSKGPDAQPVTGIVKIDGVVAASVRVQFWPVDAAPENFVNQMALGFTDADGRFKLQRGDGGEGIVAGEYRVTFSRIMRNGRPVQTSATQKPEGSGVVESIPAVYVLQDKTPEKVTVPKGGGEFTFNLKTKS